jgi:hypothetical protein
MGSRSTVKASASQKRPTKKTSSKNAPIQKSATRKQIDKKPATKPATRSTATKLRRQAAEAVPCYSLSHIHDNISGDANYSASGEELGSESEDLSAESDAQDGAGDDSESSSDGGYGDLEEMGGSFKVIMEVSLEDHARFCGCDLDSKTSRCSRVAGARRSAK